jgi:hypothetical protein
MIALVATFCRLAPLPYGRGRRPGKEFLTARHRPGNDFAGVKDILWIEGLFDGGHGVDDVHAKILLQERPLEAADAMLARQGPTQSQRHAKDIGGGAFHLFHLRRVALVEQNVGVQVAVASVAKDGNGDAPLARDLFDGCYCLRNGAARDRNVLAQLVG